MPASSRADALEKVRPGDFGVVKVVAGRWKGRLGYYERDDGSSAAVSFRQDSRVTIALEWLRLPPAEVARRWLRENAHPGSPWFLRPHERLVDAGAPWRLRTRKRSQGPGCVPSPALAGVIGPGTRTPSAALLAFLNYLDGRRLRSRDGETFRVDERLAPLFGKARSVPLWEATGVLADNLADAQPRTGRHRGPASRAKEHAASPASSTGVRLLLVADDRRVRESVAALVRSLRHELVVCDSSGFAALGPRSADAQVVLIDDLAYAHLPALAGLRSLPAARARILLMSDVYSEQGRVEAINSGIDMLLDMPVSADELGATIDSVVRHSRGLRS